MRQGTDESARVPRRDFLRAGVVLAGTTALGLSARAGAGPARGISVGIFSDSHYADRERRGSRHYRDSAAKLTEFVQAMNKAKPSFAIVLGDFVDKGKTLEAELAYLKRIEGIYRTFRGPRHHVIGNHDVATFSKDQFVAGTGMPAPHYSFESGPFHGIVLDANYKKDFSPYNAGNFHWTQTYVPPDEQKWLKADLAATKKPSLVFIHQCLDDEKGAHGVKNAPDVRKILEESGKVLAVFHGHNHRGAFRRIRGIPYLTMRAMVEGPGLENNAYALATISTTAIALRGFAKQPSRSAPAQEHGE